MTAQFHEGQEVKVQYDDGEWGSPRDTIWRKATILDCEVDYYRVQFRDGTRATFDEAQIRAVSPCARASIEHRAKRIERAANAVIRDTWRNLDTKPWPQKYAAPYGALVKLQKALKP